MARTGPKTQRHPYSRNEAIVPCDEHTHTGIRGKAPYRPLKPPNHATGCEVSPRPSAIGHTLRTTDCTLPASAAWRVQWETFSSAFPCAALHSPPAPHRCTTLTSPAISSRRSGWARRRKARNPARLASSGVSGAQDRTRTCTLSLALVPETSVSTNSTTWAWPVDVKHRCDRLTGCKGRQKIVSS